MPRIASIVPMPTIVWKETRTTFTGGRFHGGTASSPWTRAPGSWKASTESAFGMRTPYRTCPCPYRPRTCNGAPLVVLARPSIAASLVGSYLLIVRAPSRRRGPGSPRLPGPDVDDAAGNQPGAARWFIHALTEMTIHDPRNPVT